MNKSICIDREKTIGQLKFHKQDIERVVKEMAGDKSAFETGLGWIQGCIDIVSRQFRVHHDEGKCVWTRTGDSDGLVHYETQCRESEYFYQFIHEMGFIYCPFCGARIVEEEY